VVVVGTLCLIKINMKNSKMIRNILFGLIVLINLNCSGQNKTIDISLKLDVNDEYQINQNVTQNIELTINGSKQATETKINSIIVLKVEEKKNTIYILNYEYSELGMSITNPNYQYEFSSKNNNSNDAFSSLLSKIIGLKFQFKLSNKGRVIDCKGIEVYIDSLMKSLNIPENQQLQLKTQLVQYYGQETIKNTIDPFMFIYPEKPVNIDDTWNNQYINRSSIPFEYNNNYQLSQSNSEKIVIIGNSEINTINENVFGTEKNYQLSGKQIINIELNTETNFITKGVFNSTTTGFVIYKKGDEQINIPIDFTSKMVYSTSKK